MKYTNIRTFIFFSFVGFCYTVCASEELNSQLHIQCIDLFTQSKDYVSICFCANQDGVSSLHLDRNNATQLLTNYKQVKKKYNDTLPFFVKQNEKCIHFLMDGHAYRQLDIVLNHSQFLSKLYPITTEEIQKQEEFLKTTVEQGYEQLEIVLSPRGTLNKLITREELKKQKKHLEEAVEQDKYVRQFNDFITIGCETAYIKANLVHYHKDYIEVIKAFSNNTDMSVTLTCDYDQGGLCTLLFKNDLFEQGSHTVIICFHNKDTKQTILEKINKGELFGLKLYKDDGKKISFNIDIIECIGINPKKVEKEIQAFGNKIDDFTNKFYKPTGKIPILLDSIKIIGFLKNPGDIHIQLIYDEKLDSLSVLLFCDPFLRGKSFAIQLSQKNKEYFLNAINADQPFGLVLQKDSDEIVFGINSTRVEKKGIDFGALLQWCKNHFIIATGLGCAVCAATVTLMYKNNVF
jgi:hypothetical protein